MTASTGFFSSSIVLGLLAFAALALQGWLVWRLIDAVRAISRMEEKLSHFGDALSLLTETAETGFVAIGNELSKHAGAGVPVKPARISNARLNAAARRGASVSEIAAAEQLSETEVRLRMHLSKQMAAPRKPAATTPRPRRSSSRKPAAVIASDRLGPVPADIPAPPSPTDTPAA